MYVRIPDWIFKGAKIIIKSSVFGTITAVVVNITKRYITFKPERRGTDYCCNLTYQNVMLMCADNQIMPIV